MYADRIVLCGASAYEQKYYFNPDFDALPQQVKEELCDVYRGDRRYPDTGIR